MSRLAAVLASALAVGCGAPAEAPTPERPVAYEGGARVTATPIPLDPRDPKRVRVGALTYAGGAVLTATGTSRFGGLSDLMVLPALKGPQTVYAITDEGDLLTFDWLDGLTASRTTTLSVRPLPDDDGRPLTGKARSDAEDMAFDTDAAEAERWSLLVSFEREHRVRRFTPPETPSRSQAVATPGLPRLPENDGLEGLAVLFTAPERTLVLGAQDGRVWFCGIDGRAPCRLALKEPPKAGYSLSSLAHVPGTYDLVALYRDYGFRRRIMIAHVRTGLGRGGDGQVRVEPLAELAGPMNLDNFEGVAVGPNYATRGQRLYIVSDDNFDPKRQRTLLMAFDWEPGEALK